MWFDESVFYQIYPLGYCGAERENDYGEVRHRFSKIQEDIPRIRDLGVKAVLFNPLLESERHGYDTVDFFKADRRLGTNEELKELIKAFHEAGIRVVFDGVFHHTGREFAPFVAVRKERENTDYRFWFNINFSGNSAYNDGFWYDNWEGHPELVKLRLENADLQNYLMDAVRFWVQELDIDGLRLDVCYSLPYWFLERLRREVNALKSDFFLLGEVIHIGNFREAISSERLNSITDYECYKGLVSACNSDNLFEIGHSLERLFDNKPWSLYTGKNLFSFADNHDVPRVMTQLADKRKILPLYTVLFTMPGIPCVYYGSEYGAEGGKGDGDVHLRPAMENIDKTAHPEIYAHLKTLAKIRTTSRALAYGCFERVVLQNKYLCYKRSAEGESILVAVNISAEPVTFRAGDGEGEELIGHTRCPLSSLTLEPFSSKIIRV